MKISSQLAFWLSLPFAVLCIAYGLFGFWSTDVSMPEAQRADAHGFAWFWMFLGSIGLVAALVAWRLGRHDAPSINE